MGINKNTLRFILLAKKTGVDFSKTAMIGRQTLNMPVEHFVDVMENESGFKEARSVWKNIYEERYAEKLFQYLGAATIDSFDYSDYEKATFLHDFNTPVPDSHKNKYSLVIDGGSLEHIFNFPIALKNCMELTAVNGHFITATPSNNYFGHGFYQFSPELFYRTLSDDNGFKVNCMYYYDDKYSKHWKSVADPDKVKRRVTLINSKEVMLILLSQRMAQKPIFNKTPQQSDYVAVWDSGADRSKRKKKTSGLWGKIKNMIPITFKLWVNQKLHGGPNKDFFTDVDIVSLLKK